MATEFKSKIKDKSLQTREAENLTTDTSHTNVPFPKNCLIELSNACNHRCIFCTNPRMSRGIGKLDFETYKKFIIQSVALGLEEVGLYATGEPFITKDLDKYIKFAKDSGISYVYITTNGGLATEEKLKRCISAGLDSIKFSINAGTRETYKLVHGKDDFNKVINNIAFLSRHRKEENLDLKIYASCVVTRYVESEKEALEEKIGDYVDSMVFYDVSPQAGQTLKYYDLMSIEGKEQVVKNKPGPCSMLWNKIHLTCEGYLTLCCVDYENSLTYADININSVSEAWNNNVIMEMRKRHQQQDLKGTLCHNCLYGEDIEAFPITKIGREDNFEKVSFDKPSGVKDILSRIEKLKNDI